jgi:choline dehydrogenase-like flavoprotein
MKSWQVKPASFHGYDAEDPLDWVKQRMLLMMGVAFIVTLISLYIIYYVARVADLHPPWLFWVEVAFFTGPFAWASIFTRKWAFWVLPLLTVAFMLPIDLWVEAHVRMQGKTALWMYNPWGIGALTPVLRGIVVWGGDALIHGPLCLWIARMIACAWKKPADAPATWKEHDEVFRKEWTRDEVADVSRDVGFYIFRLIAFAYAGYVVLAALGSVGFAAFPNAVQGMLRQTYENPALTVNTFTKIAAVCLCANLAAWNRKLRVHAGLVVLLAHAASTVASLALYFATPAVRVPEYRLFLLMSAAVDGVIMLLVGIAMFLARKDAWQRRPLLPELFSLPEKISRVVYIVLGFGWLAFIYGVLYARFALDPFKGFGLVYGFPDPQVSNTITMFTTLAVIAFLSARDPELREHFHPVVSGSLFFGVVCSLIWLLVGDAMTGLSLANRENLNAGYADWYFVLKALSDGGVALLLIGLRKMVYDVDLTITTLSPTAARDAAALHEAVFAPVFRAGETVDDYGYITPAIDRHVADIRGRKRGLLALPFTLFDLVLTPMAALRPWFSSMSVEERRWFLRHGVLRTPHERARAIIPELADLTYKLGTAAHAFVSLAHYAHARGRAGLYVPAESRERLQGDLPSGGAGLVTEAQLPTGPNDPRNDAPVATFAPPLIRPAVVSRSREASIPDEVDYVVIGSGAGGGVVAYRLAEANPNNEILVLERGPRIIPPVSFDGDEMGMTRKLYKEGGLQQTKRFDLTVLQGECVGGSTVINNAICVKMPDRIRDDWKNLGLPVQAIATEYTRVEQEIEIAPLSKDAINDQVRKVFEDAVNTYNATATERLSNPFVLSANHRHQLGHGLCNLGDRRLRKRSTLETYVAWAEGRGVRVIPETTAVCFEADGKNAKAVMIRSANGGLRRVKVRKAVIVSGGVIASSHFLMRSGLNGNVGKNVACNLALAAVLELPQRLDAFDGVQIAIAAEDLKARAIFETWFSPPASFALGMPLFFDSFLGLMDRYKNLLAFGSLIGTRGGGEISPRPDLLNGRALSFKLSNEDRANIGFALGTQLRLARAAGAKRVAIATAPGMIVDDMQQIDTIANKLAAYPYRTDDLRLVTAHPQGGNAMSPDPGKGVVDTDGRVYGYDNVYVADASVFPGGITVNPQWTIMALSSHIAGRIFATHG